MTILQNIIIFTLLSLTFKITPHIANFSPQIVFFLMLGRLLPVRILLPIIIIIAVITDLLTTTNYQAFGSWTLFTYSAYIFIGVIGNLDYYSKKAINLNYLNLAIFSSLYFWLWTNFGVWCTSQLYPHCITGFIQCYIMALPFLANSLLASILAMMPFIILHKMVNLNFSSMLCHYKRKTHGNNH